MFSFFSRKKRLSPGGNEMPISLDPAKTLKFSCDRVVYKGEDRSLIVIDAPWPNRNQTTSLGFRSEDSRPSSAPDSQTSEPSVLLSEDSQHGEFKYGGVKKLPSGKLVRREDGGSFSLFGVFDGHNGYEAAEYLQSHIKDRVTERLPASPVLPPRDSLLFEEYCCKLRRALVAAVIACETDFAQLGIPSGATVSLILVVEDVATVVNVGDSTVFFDSGVELVRVSEDHNVGIHKAEMERLRIAGIHCAQLHPSLTRPLYAGEGGGVGPVRLWPGGLALSRAFADFDASSAVISAPHVTQVILPATGGRFFMASDGIWGAWPCSDEAKAFLAKQRKVETGIAVSNLIKKMYYTTGLKDDCSVIVIDSMQGHNASFVHVANEVRKTSMPSSAAASMHGFVPGSTLPLVNCGMASSLDYGSIAPASRLHPKTEIDRDFAALILKCKEQARGLWMVAERGESFDAIKAARKLIKI